MHTYVFIFVEEKHVTHVDIQADTLVMAYDKILARNDLRGATLQMVYVIT